MIKRLFDLLFSISVLIVLIPVILVVALLVFIKMGWPIVFTQLRPGKGGKPFKIYKFRSMIYRWDKRGVLLPDAKRLTQFGQFLRSTSCDELPALWNVLKGEMSIVGPRPNLVNQDELIYERDKLNIYKFLPGITGISQINNISIDNPKLLAESDSKMVTSFNYNLYFYCILRTCFGAGYGDQYK